MNADLRESQCAAVASGIGADLAKQFARDLARLVTSAWRQLPRESRPEGAKDEEAWRGLVAVFYQGISAEDDGWRSFALVEPFGDDPISDLRRVCGSDVENILAHIRRPRAAEAIEHRRRLVDTGGEQVCTIRNTMDDWKEAEVVMNRVLSDRSPVDDREANLLDRLIFPQNHPISALAIRLAGIPVFGVYVSERDVNPQWLIKAGTIGTWLGHLAFPFYARLAVEAAMQTLAARLVDPKEGPRVFLACAAGFLEPSEIRIGDVSLRTRNPLSLSRTVPLSGSVVLRVTTQKRDVTEQSTDWSIESPGLAGAEATESDVQHQLDGFLTLLANMVLQEKYRVSVESDVYEWFVKAKLVFGEGTGLVQNLAASHLTEMRWQLRRFGSWFNKPAAPNSPADPWKERWPRELRERGEDSVKHWLTYLLTTGTRDRPKVFGKIRRFLQKAPMDFASPVASLCAALSATALASGDPLAAFGVCFKRDDVDLLLDDLAFRLFSGWNSVDGVHGGIRVKVIADEVAKGALTGPLLGAVFVAMTVLGLGGRHCVKTDVCVHLCVTFQPERRLFVFDISNDPEVDEELLFSDVQMDFSAMKATGDRPETNKLTYWIYVISLIYGPVTVRSSARSLRLLVEDLDIGPKRPSAR